MYFASKFTGILTTIVVSAMSAQAFAAVVPHNAESQQAQLSVTFFDQQNFGGMSFFPLNVQEGTPNNLPPEWTNRARSLIISIGFICQFIDLANGQGTLTLLSGFLNPVFPTAIDTKIDSFTCTKTGE